MRRSRSRPQRDDRLRIAHFSATFPPYYAGSGNACFYQAEALAARGHHVEVFTASYPGEPQDPTGVLTHRYGARLRLGNAPFIPQLALVDGFDILHLHQPFIFGAEAALAAHVRTGAPLVSSYHNELQADGVKGLLFAGYDALVTRTALRRSAKLTVLSMEHAREAPLLAAELARRPEAFAPAPNGVDVDTFHPGGEPELRAQLGLPADATVAAVCAKLDAAHLTKRIDLAIEATARLPELTLLVIGGGPLLERYQAQAAALGIADRIRFVGDQRHAAVARHIRAADLLLMPSTLESFGIVQLEAMACARPVVISRLAGARGVSLDGVHGVHVEPGSLDDLVRGLRTLLDAGPEGRRRMGEAAREHVVAHYTWQRSAELLEDAYREAASGARRARTASQ
jgi:glycosyltransferase involved in cell wall biosynthesis